MMAFKQPAGALGWWREKLPERDVIRMQGTGSYTHLWLRSPSCVQGRLSGRRGESRGVGDAWLGAKGEERTEDRLQSRQQGQKRITPTPSTPPARKPGTVNGSLTSTRSPMHWDQHAHPIPTALREP